MIPIAVTVAGAGYLLFHWGYYFAKGAPITILDELLPSRRSKALDAIQKGYSNPNAPTGNSGAGYIQVQGGNPGPAGTGPLSNAPGVLNQHPGSAPGPGPGDLRGLAPPGTPVRPT